MFELKRSNFWNLVSNTNEYIFYFQAFPRVQRNPGLVKRAKIELYKSKDILPDLKKIYKEFKRDASSREKLLKNELNELYDEAHASLKEGFLSKVTYKLLCNWESRKQQIKRKLRAAEFGIEECYHRYAESEIFQLNIQGDETQRVSIKNLDSRSFG